MALNLLFSFVLLGLTEALIKPLAKHFIQRELRRALPMLFAAIDPHMPDWLRNCTPPELEERVRRQLTAITGSDWSSKNIDLVFELYDPRKGAGRVQ
jgi:hypothetical protein